MKTYMRPERHKNSTPKHKPVRITTEVSSWNDQEMNIGGGKASIMDICKIHCNLISYYYCDLDLEYKHASVTNYIEKVQAGNDQEMAQPERTSHSTNRRVGKNQNDTN